MTCGFDGCPTPRDIQTFQPDQGGRILDRYNRVMGRLELVRRVNVPLSAVPVFVQQAFVATEDRRFYQHGGLDWRGVFRALAANIKASGIILWTIQVNTSGDPTSTLLQNCASTPDKFFLLTSASAIAATFDNIGKQMTKLHLAN